MLEMQQIERMGAIAWSVLATYSIHALATVVLARLVVACLPRARLALATEVWRGAALIALITTSVVLIFDPAGRNWDLPVLEEPTFAPLVMVDGEVLAQSALESTKFADAPTSMLRDVDLLQLPALASPLARTEPIVSLSLPHDGHDWRWLAGILLLSLSSLGLLRWATNLFALRQMINRCQPAQEQELRLLLDGLRERAGVTWPVALKISDEVDSPLAIGSSLIVLPRELAQSQDDSLIRAAMAHELAHLLRGDPHWLVFVQMLVYATPWLPTQRWIAAGIHQGMEKLCDDLAVRMLGNGLELAKSLQWVAQRMSNSQLKHEVPAMMTHSKHQLVSRVQHLLSDTAGRLALRGGAATWVLGAAIATSVIYIFPGFALSADAHQLEDVAPDKVVAAPPVVENVNASPTRQEERVKARHEREKQGVDARSERSSQREAKRQARQAKRQEKRQKPAVSPRPPHPPAPPKPTRVMVTPPTPPQHPIAPKAVVAVEMSEIDAELAKLGQEMGELAVEISREVGQIAATQTVEITKQAAALAKQASEVAMLQMQLASDKAAELSKAQVDALNAKIQHKEAEIARTEKNIEAQAARLEAHMQKRSAALEAKIEAKAAKFEEKMKQHAAKLEKAAAKQTRAEKKSK